MQLRSKEIPEETTTGSAMSRPEIGQMNSLGISAESVAEEEELGFWTREEGEGEEEEARRWWLMPMEGNQRGFPWLPMRIFETVHGFFLISAIREKNERRGREGERQRERKGGGGRREELRGWL